MKLIFIYLITLNISAATISNQSIGPTEVSEYSSIIIDSLWEQAGHKKSIVTPVVDKINVDNKTIEPNPKLVEPIEPNKPITKIKIDKIKGLKNSTGKLKLKDKVNPLDKYRKIKEKSPITGTGLSFIEQQKAKNRQEVAKRMKALKNNSNNKKEKSIYDLRNEGLNKLKQKNNATLSQWKSKVKQTYKRWANAREDYIKKVPHYKKATFNFNLESSYTNLQKRKMKKPRTTAISSEYHLIPNSLDLKIRDQGRRPTCAAFTGIRAIETLAMGKNIELDLSEQYFYWASKPKCQQSPCTLRGSWIVNAFNKSKNSTTFDIPSDTACPYNAKSVGGNETQTPLRYSCQQGSVKVKSYEKLYSWDEVLNSLSKNSPIIAGFKLSPNFYKSKGLVTYKESITSGSMDSHAAGHALLLIGYMKLPRDLHISEGKICYIVANSWGEGWGRGGFGCLSENWVKNYKIDNPFVALNQIQIKE